MSFLGSLAQRISAQATSKCRLRYSPNINFNLTQVRTAVIYHLPRVSEVKRVRKQGFEKRVKTEIGRKYIMTRILKSDRIVSQ